MRVGELVGGRYRLIAPLGRGAMGQVFRATDERLRRDVAIKTVDVTNGSDRTVAERFHREAIATAKLNHPNIVTIFDTGSDGGTAWLVMELLPGRPVSQVIREEGPLPEAGAVAIAQQVAEALVATHAIGVVHRDIKPANIMVSGLRATLLDFGIAQVSLDAEAHLTAPATTLGTAAYMSPEQAQGHRATAASDVYALGGVMVAMLTGHPPYPGDNAIQIAGRHITEPPVSVRARRPDLSATVDDLILRMMAKDAAARPTATIVARALTHLAHNPDAARTAILPAAAAAVAAPPATAVLPAASTPPPAATAQLPAATAQAPVYAAAPPSAHRVTTRPAAPGPGGTMNAQPFRTAATWIGVLVAAIVVFMVSWAIGATLFGSIPAVPAVSTSPSPEPSPEPTRPVGRPILPSAQEAARKAALGAGIAGVDAALGALPTDTQDAARTSSALKRAWGKTSKDLQDDRKPREALDSFRDEIDQQRDDGTLRAWEAEGIKLAVAAVEAVLPPA